MFEDVCLVRSASERDTPTFRTCPRYLPLIDDFGCGGYSCSVGVVDLVLNATGETAER